MSGTKPFDPARVDFTAFALKHFGWRLDRKVATVTFVAKAKPVFEGD
jgi:hypothetical protein